MINGKTKLIGILGWPVEHSLSPALHNASFSSLDLDCAYVPLPVNHENLETAIGGLRAFGFIGANVTIPHKVSIMPFLDKIDESAQIIGAVNTITINNGRCIGYNTDAQGFINSLLSQDVTVKNRKAVILGAGGAARAVACGLLKNGAKLVTVCARHTEKAEAFVNSFNNTSMIGMSWLDRQVTTCLSHTDILVNCTPLGMHPDTSTEPPIEWESLNAQAVVCDLVYNPLNTTFLKQASSRGHKIVTGVGMLVEQGALAFEMWTGRQAPRSVMHQIVRDMLS